MTTPPRRCITCRHAEPCDRLPVPDPYQASLECRFNTPLAFEIGGLIQTHWPTVRGEHWCNQHALVDATGLSDRLGVDTIEILDPAAVEWARDTLRQMLPRRSELSDMARQENRGEVEEDPEYCLHQLLIAFGKYSASSPVMVLKPSSGMRLAVDKLMGLAKRTQRHRGAHLEDTIVLKRCALP